MKVKVADLTGPALDWAVAKCEGEDYLPERAYDGIGNEYPATRYSTNWAQGGPIIERENITTIRCDDDYTTNAHGYITHKSKRIPVWGAVIGQQCSEKIYGRQGDYWGHAYSIDQGSVIYGPTPLIAAMRCYVASKLGDSVDIPKELL